MGELGRKCAFSHFLTQLVWTNGQKDRWQTDRQMTDRLMNIWTEPLMRICNWKWDSGGALMQNRNKLNRPLICIHYRRNSASGRYVGAGLNCRWIIAFFMSLYFGNLSTVNIIFHKHFLGKTEIDSNSYQLIFHKDSKSGWRIVIFHVFIFYLRRGRIGAVCDLWPRFWPT